MRRVGARKGRQRKPARADRRARGLSRIRLAHWRLKLRRGLRRRDRSASSSIRRCGAFGIVRDRFVGAVVAAHRRSDRDRSRHAVARRRDRKEYRQPHQVEIGGTQIERDENGRTSVRIRDILIRDADGAVVASAPKAEVGFSGSGLLGQVRAKRVSLVGADLSVRIEEDGQITSLDRRRRGRCGHARPSLKPAATSAPRPGARCRPSHPDRRPALAALLAWIDGGLGPTARSSGLDGQGLGEIGLKNGVLNVDDQRSNRHWTFEHINFSVTRPAAAASRQSRISENEARPWSLTAACGRPGSRPPQDPDRSAQGAAKEPVPLRPARRADFAVGHSVVRRYPRRDRPDACRKLSRAACRRGRPDRRSGRCRKPHSARQGGIQPRLGRRAPLAVVPFQIHSGANRVTLLASSMRPRQASAPWTLAMAADGRARSAAAGEDAAGAQPHHGARQFRSRAEALHVEQGDIGTRSQRRDSTRHPLSGNFIRRRAASGGRPCQHPDERAALKRIWPAFVASKVRSWVLEIIQRTIERVEIATNAPIDTLKERAADSRRWPVGRGRRSATPSCARWPACRRSARPICTRGSRAACDGQCRTRHGRVSPRPQAHVQQRRVRSSGHRSESAAGARALPHRWSGPGGRRIARARAVARISGPPIDPAPAAAT